ncbi:MAG: hypothetical protein KF729_29400 [Sandaracinaceae bacterium]|nr:hypothetical protein [Sandaracinaceae bacterium]
MQSENCHELALVLRTRLAERHIAGLRTERSAPLPWAPDAPGGSGSPAQLAAAPAVTPVPLVGAAASFVGAPSGPRAVAALALNPGALAANALDDRAALSVWSRAWDVSVVLPFPLTDSGATYNVDFVGVRVRVNALAPVSAETAAEQHRSLAQTGAYEAEVDEGFRALLEGARDTVACTRALERAIRDDEPSDEAVRRACGAVFPSRARRWRDVEAVLADIDQRVRQEADRFYLGFDLRYDYGDRALTGEPAAARASTLLAAVAAGARVVTEPSLNLRVRGRAGAHYSHVPGGDPSESDLNPISLDAAAAIELELPLVGELFRASVGIEGRGIIEGTDVPVAGTNRVTDTEFLELRLAVLVPVGGGPGLGIDLAVPLLGAHRSVQVAVSGDFSLFER